MKFFLHPLIVLSCMLPFFLNCSSVPEIKPYELPEVGKADEDITNYDPKDDSVFKDELDLEDAKIPMDDEVAKEEKSTPDESSTDESTLDESTSSDVLAEDKAEETKVARPEKPVRAPASMPTPSHKPGSVFKNGYYTFSSDCGMKTQPTQESSDAGIVPAGKKLWLDGHNSTWLKAYKKAGTVYVPSKCVN